MTNSKKQNSRLTLTWRLTVCSALFLLSLTAERGEFSKDPLCNDVLRLAKGPTGPSSQSGPLAGAARWSQGRFSKPVSVTLNIMCMSGFGELCEH